MGILDRVRERRAKKAGNTPVMPVGQEAERPNEELSVTTLEPPAPPVSQPAGTTAYAPNEELSMTDMNAPAPPEVKPAGTSVTTQPASTYTAPSWINAGSYEKAAQMDPNISRGQYAYELSRYRREQGQPDLSYAEWSQIIKGQDPYETAAERQKRDRNLRIANQINAVGSFLNALVNYNRVKSGHVGYTPDKGTEGYNRLERIRQGQEALARSNAKDYLGMIAQDRAERAKAEAAKAAAERDARDYQLKVEDLKWKIENARTEAGRKKAQDELNRLKFEEQQRHNKAMEGAAWVRANKEGSSGTKKYLELQTSKGKKRYTPEAYGNNWIHQAYQDMLKEKGGVNYKVDKRDWLNNPIAPTEQEMYDAITKFNDSQWMNQYKSNRYGSGGDGGEKSPLE